MNGRSYQTGRVVSAACVAGFLFWGTHAPGQTKESVRYKVLTPVIKGNLAVYPVVGTSFETATLLTLDEGIRSGQVVVTELSQSTGLIRPRPVSPGIWDERPFPVPRRSTARVNELAIVNNSGRPLLLLAGEIVTGGKQDRVVGKDRIIPAHSEPISLDVFCVEPHRWTETSAGFRAMGFSMAQPSVRLKAMAVNDQQQVWEEVAKSRAAFVAGAPSLDLRALQSTSSYAATMQSDSVKQQIETIAVPIERSYAELSSRLRSEKAVGAVVAVGGELIWADVFASSALLEKYWPKLIRSYAAESLSGGVRPTSYGFTPRAEQAQRFLDRLGAKHESVETEPGLYRNTEITGEDFEAFILTALLPNTGFDVHIAKMKR